MIFAISPCNAKCVIFHRYDLQILTGGTLDYAINNNLTPFISMQNHYNLVYREEEREMFPTLKVSMCLLLSDTTLNVAGSYLASARYRGLRLRAAY